MSSMANLLSLIVNRKNMTQVSYLVGVILWVLNGVNPSYQKLNNNIKNKLVTDILLFFTPLNEAIKMILIDELEEYPDYYNYTIQQIYDMYEVDPNYNYKLYLFLYGLALKVLALITIYIVYKIKFRK